MDLIASAQSSDRSAFCREFYLRCMFSLHMCTYMSCSVLVVPAFITIIFILSHLIPFGVCKTQLDPESNAHKNSAWGHYTRFIRTLLAFRTALTSHISRDLPYNPHEASKNGTMTCFGACHGPAHDHDCTADPHK